MTDDTLTPAERDLYRRCRAIRDRYADGVPLGKDDRATVLTALRRHPHGREKFGAGVDAVVVDTYIMGTRAFFVVRADGTAEDFSLRKCFGLPTGTGSKAVLAAKKRFDYRAVLARFRTFLGMRSSRRMAPAGGM